MPHYRSILSEELEKKSKPLSRLLYTNGEKFTMRACLLTAIRQPLEFREVPRPQPRAGELLIRVSTCALCRTDLHIFEGELEAPHLPLILGHQIVGEVATTGKGVTGFKRGDRVGVAWLAKSCGQCIYCEEGRENLCDHAEFTGFHRPGGLADYCVADAAFVFPLPSSYNSTEVAPLLCAGMIGYRSLRLIGNAKRIGFYGFGAAAHLLIQVARHQKKSIYVFTRPGDLAGQHRAMQLGANWAGDSKTTAPDLLDAALIFAPVGELVPAALKALRKGGEVVCAGIHMSDIPSFPYSILWGERSVRSVANLTREDGREFLRVAPEIPIRPEITLYPFEETNRALQDLKAGLLKGSAVISIHSP